jgi:hypothetical protein
MFLDDVAGFAGNAVWRDAYGFLDILGHDCFVDGGGGPGGVFACATGFAD